MLTMNKGLADPVADAWRVWMEAKESNDRKAAAEAFKALQKATRPMMEGEHDA